MLTRKQVDWIKLFQLAVWLYITPGLDQQTKLSIVTFKNVNIVAMFQTIILKLRSSQIRKLSKVKFKCVKNLIASKSACVVVSHY